MLVDYCLQVKSDLLAKKEFYILRVVKKLQLNRDLVDAEEIKKRWKEYTEELYKKEFNEPGNYDGVVSHPEPDILECEVDWALGNTAVKASGCDGILVAVHSPKG